jgi:hypothetical protein
MAGHCSHPVHQRTRIGHRVSEGMCVSVCLCLNMCMCMLFLWNRAREHEQGSIYRLHLLFVKAHSFMCSVQLVVLLLEIVVVRVRGTVVFLLSSRFSFTSSSLDHPLLFICVVPSVSFLPSLPSCLSFTCFPFTWLLITIHLCLSFLPFLILSFSQHSFVLVDVSFVFLISLPVVCVSSCLGR